MKSCTAPASTTPAISHRVPGRITHLRRQHRADQGACTGNRRKVVTEKDVFVGRYEVQTVVIDHCGGGPSWIELHHVIGDEQTVVAIGDQIDRHCCDDDTDKALIASPRARPLRPERTHLLGQYQPG